MCITGLYSIFPPSFAVLLPLFRRVLGHLRGKRTQHSDLSWHTLATYTHVFLDDDRNLVERTV